MVNIIDDAYLKRYIELYRIYMLHSSDGIYENISNTSDNDYNSDGELIDSDCYEPEEPSATRYNIVLCELYNEGIHGVSTIGSHYLVNCRYKCLNLDEIRTDTNHIMHPYMIALWRRAKHVLTHQIYRNYNNIISRQNYIKPEIAECIYLETHECVAILKTFWIRLIQRTWKTVMRRRADVIQKRTNPIALYNREITGNWSSDCSIYPGLRGMLNPIKN